MLLGSLSKRRTLPFPNHIFSQFRPKQILVLREWLWKTTKDLPKTSDDTLTLTFFYLSYPISYFQQAESGLAFELDSFVNQGCF